MYAQNTPNTRKRSALGDGAGSSFEVDYEGLTSIGGRGAEAPDVKVEETPSPAKRTRSCEKEEEMEEGLYRCAPCGFNTPDQTEFQRHIPRHRDSESSLQCVQCGACFASAASLSRHRFITHRLRQDQQEGDHVSSHMPKREEGERADEEGEGNLSCRVCGRHFDKASDLSTHFRTHGMAFINSHKTDKVV